MTEHSNAPRRDARDPDVRDPDQHNPDQHNLDQHNPDQHNPDVRALAIMGPTAAGKGELGRQAAKRLGLPLLVCDSVKVYRGLDIGSGKPDAEARAALDHRLLDLADPDQSFSAGEYARAAWAQLRGSQGRGLFVGGTGFYLRAVGWTLSGAQSSAMARPPDDPQRAAFEAELHAAEVSDPGAIHRALGALDPELAGSIHPRNLVRLLRALWLVKLHGRAVSETRRADPPRARLRLLMVVLDPGPTALQPRIEARLARMLERGFLAEVESLHAAGYDASSKAMRSLGYRQMLEVVEGRRTLAEARDAIIVATRQYAKRQRTFLRSQLPAERIVTVRSAADCPWALIEQFFTEPTRRAS